MKCVGKPGRWPRSLNSTTNVEPVRVPNSEKSTRFLFRHGLYCPLDRVGWHSRANALRIFLEARHLLQPNSWLFQENNFYQVTCTRALLLDPVIPPTCASMVPGRAPPRDRRVASAAVVARSHFKRGSFTEPPLASAALVLDDGCPKKACGTRVSCSRGADHGARGECARGHVVRFCTVCCRFVAQESFVRQDARGHPEGHAPRHCGAQDNKGGQSESRRAANRLAEPAPAAARTLPPPPVASSSICTAVGGATTGAARAHVCALSAGGRGRERRERARQYWRHARGRRGQRVLGVAAEAVPGRRHPVRGAMDLVCPGRRRCSGGGREPRRSGGAALGAGPRCARAARR